MSRRQSYTCQTSLDEQAALFSPSKRNKLDESPVLTDPESFSEEELFHLEMSDEGSGGKRSKMDRAPSADLNDFPCLCGQDFGFIAQPQKRGAMQPLCTSAAENVTTKKARTTDSVKQKWIQQQQAMKEEDDDPHMARAAVYYLLVIEDNLVNKNFYDGKNRIHSKSISITVQHRQKLLDWLFRVNLQFSFHFDTWVLTATVLDRFLSAQPIEKDVFQLAGCAAFLIAAKHEERFPPKISELVDICARCYNKIDFLKMERIMLLVLEWKVVTPSVNVLVREVSLIQNGKDFNQTFLTNIIKRIVFHKSLAYMPPSKVAFSLMSAADCDAGAEDVNKTFRYLLYLLKQAPDEDEESFAL